MAASATCGRLPASVAGGRHVAPGIKAFVVPGSERVKRRLRPKHWIRCLKQAGFEWREAGCSMCLAMNPDKLQGRQISASSSNRNFKGRQGSSSGRTSADEPRHGGHSGHRRESGGCAIAAQPYPCPRCLGVVINDRRNPCLWNVYSLHRDCRRGRGNTDPASLSP
jgi:hypothetical protein